MSQFGIFTKNLLTMSAHLLAFQQLEMCEMRLSMDKCPHVYIFSLILNIANIIGEANLVLIDQISDEKICIGQC